MENNTSNEEGLSDAAAARGEAFHQAVKKTKIEYYAMKNYVVMQGSLISGERVYLIAEKSYDEAKDQHGDVDLLKLKRLAAKEDFFQIIQSHHLMKHHAASRNTWNSIHECYSNISRDIFNKYVCLCSCRVNQRIPSRLEGITPLLSKTFNDRGQMDLIDMQSNILME
jgi:hypothetical protein